MKQNINIATVYFSSKLEKNLKVFFTLYKNKDLQDKQNKVAKISDLPTIPETASVWIGCTANINPENIKLKFTYSNFVAKYIIIFTSFFFQKYII